MRKCIICGKMSNDGIRLGDSFICTECEKVMTNAIPGTDEYDALLDALRNIKLPVALSVPQAAQDDGLVETYIVASVAELLAYVGLGRLGSADAARAHPEFGGIDASAGQGDADGSEGIGSQGDMGFDEITDLDSLARLADLVEHADLDALDDIDDFDGSAGDSGDDDDAQDDADTDDDGGN